MSSSQKQPECPLGNYDRETGTTHPTYSLLPPEQLPQLPQPLSRTRTPTTIHHHGKQKYRNDRRCFPRRLRLGLWCLQLRDCGGCSFRDCGRLRVSRQCCVYLFFIVAGVIAIAIIIYMLTRHRTSPVKYVLIPRASGGQQ